MAGKNTPVDPLEMAVISHLLEKLPKTPLWIIGEVLGLSAPQVQHRIKKMGRKPKGRGCQNANAFIWSYKRGEHLSLPDAPRAALHNLWIKLLREESRRICRNPLCDEELSPADALYKHRRKLPAFVWMELFGLDDKGYRRIAGAVGAKLAQAEAPRVTALLYRSDDLPELEGMPKSQVEKIRAIVERLRLKKQGAFSKQKEEHAAELLASLKKEKTRLRRKGQTQLFECHGRCGESWQRTDFFFFVDPCSQGGLQCSCKFCEYNKKGEREKKGKKKNSRDRAPILSKDRVRRITEVLPCLSGHVPTCYIMKAFDLSHKQYQRLMIEATCKAPKHKGETILLHFRLYGEKEFPAFSCLTPAERTKLLAVWKKDIEEWRQELERKDAATWAVMEAEQARKDKECARTKIACRVCGKQFEWTKENFPAKNQVGFKTHCRVCHIRIRRKEAHQRFKEEGR